MSAADRTRRGQTVYGDMGSSNQAAVVAVRRYFAAFLASLSTDSKQKLSLRGNASTFDSVASDIPLTFEVATSYLSFYARSAEGLANDAITSQTLVAHTYNLFLAYRVAKGVDVDAKVRKQVVTHVHDELIPELKLPKHAKLPTFSNDAVGARVVSATFTDAVFPQSARRKIEVLLYLSTAFDCGQRVCETVGKEVKAGENPADIRRLTWDLVRIKLVRQSENRPNAVFVTIPIIGAKNEKDKDELREFGFKDGAIHRSPAFPFLVLAEIDGVLPGDWSVKNLFNPASLPAGDESIEVKMAESAFGKPVLQTRDGDPWTPHTARYSLKTASKAAGLNLALLPHAIRRSVAVGLTLNGKQTQNPFL